MARRIPNAPNRGVWLAALIIGGLGIVLHFFNIEPLAELKQYNYWMLLSGFLLLAIGTTSRNI